MASIDELRASGNAAFSAGDWAGAARCYTKALAACDHAHHPPGVHLLFSNRAAAHLKLGQAAAALADAEAALAAEPRFVKALFRKAAALQQLGRHEAAAAAARQASRLEPGNREVQALLRRAEQAAAAPPAGAAAAPPAAPRKPSFSAVLLPPLLARAPWEYVPSPDVDENLLLLLHGLGDRPAAFARLARSMALPQTAALALGGPQEVPFSEGGRSWFTVFDEGFELIQGRPGEQRRLRSLSEAAAALQALLAALRAACGWQARRVHVLGFSQGGTLALELSRLQQAAGDPLGSCVSVAGALLPERLTLGLAAAGGGGGAEGAAGGPAAGGTPVLITHGSADAVVSRRLVDDTAAALRAAHGLPVEVQAVPGKGHAMVQGPAEMRSLMAFWAKTLSRRPTAADLPPGAGSGDGELLEVRPGEVTLERLEEPLA